MYEREEDGDLPDSQVGNIRLIQQDTTIGEITFKISKEEMVIDELFIKPQFRRRGFGTQLLRQAEKMAGEIGLKHISLRPSPIDTMNMTVLKKWYSDRGYSQHSRNYLRKSTAPQKLI